MQSDYLPVQCQLLVYKTKTLPTVLPAIELELIRTK
jgi:hypothetical protein